MTCTRKNESPTVKQSPGTPRRRCGPHASIAVSAPARPNAEKPARHPDDEIVELAELGQEVLEVFGGSKRRDHSDLWRARTGVRTAAAQRRGNVRWREAWCRGRGGAGTPF
jgi:hypothetical protein